MQPAPPAFLLEHIYNAFQPIGARQGVDIRLDMDEQAPAILVDEGRMLQALKNLAENALRHTPSGGRITLKTVRTDQAQMHVIDSGSGIEPEDLPYVFDRFFSADKSRGVNAGKMGLGLAICKALVTAQGGKITAESEGKDRGTTMILAFDPAPAEG